MTSLKATPFGELAATDAAVRPQGNPASQGKTTPPDRPHPSLSFVLAGHTGPVAVAVAADGSFVVTGSSDGTARVWDAASGVVRHELAGHTGPVGAVAVVADGSFVVTGSSDGTARVWDAASGAVRHELAGHTGSVAAVAVAADGSFVVTCSGDRTARVWEPDGLPYATIKTDTPLTGCTVAGKDTVVAIGGNHFFGFVFRNSESQR